MNRESNSPKLAVLDEIERIAGAKLDPALKYSLRFTAVSNLHLIRLRDFIDDAVKRAAREAASAAEVPLGYGNGKAERMPDSGGPPSSRRPGDCS